MKSNPLYSNTCMQVKIYENMWCGERNIIQSQRHAFDDFTSKKRFFSISKLTSSTATTLVKPTLNTLYKFFMLRSFEDILMSKFGLTKIIKLFSIEAW